jgi:hypothetical protein
MQEHTPGASSGGGRKDLAPETAATQSEYSREGGGTGRVSEAGVRTQTTAQNTGPGSSGTQGNNPATRGSNPTATGASSGGGVSTAGSTPSARDAKEHLKQDAKSAIDEAKRAGREAWDEARDAARDAAETTKTRAEEMAETQKERAAEKIEGYGSAVHRAADKLREEEDENIAHYADVIAGEFDRAAGYLRQRDLRSLMHDIEDGIRRRPEVALGALFIAGIALARFVKASSPAPRRYAEPYGDYPYDDYDDDYDVYGDEFAAAGSQGDFDAVVAPTDVSEGQATPVSSTPGASGTSPGTVR